MNKNRPFYFLLAFTEGAFGLNYELCAHRMIAPGFGLSLRVWSTILAFTFLGLAAGYFAGSFLYVKWKVKPLSLLVLLSILLVILMLIITDHLLPRAFHPA